MTNCSDCGKYIPENAKFCAGCGNNLLVAQKAKTQNEISTENPCIWCKQTVGYKEEEAKLDSKFGFTAHKVRMFICLNCGYVHLFGLGRTIWDFD